MLQMPTRETDWIKTPKGFEILRNYDGDDRLIQKRVLDKQNGIDRRTSHTYNTAGNLLSVTVKRTEKGEELRSSYQYDLKDRLTHKIGQNQAVTCYLYD